MGVRELKDLLVNTISSFDDIVGIGQTGDINAPLIPGQSDIDLFILCTSVPSCNERQKTYAEISSFTDDIMMEVSEGGIWGHGDIFGFGGISIMPMYFTIDEMRSYLEEILAGEHVRKEGRFFIRPQRLSLIIFLFYFMPSTILISRPQTHGKSISRF